MKYEVGDKVKIVSLQSRGRRDCRNVVGDIGVVVDIDSRDCRLPYEVKIECGGRYWWEESNLELIEDTKPNTSVGEAEMNATNVETTTPKFKKGDKVIRVGNTSADGVEFGEVYTVKNPSSHLGFYNGKLHNYVTLEEEDVVTPNEDCLELYIEPRNYRNMKPTDLIKISVDGVESEVPLGVLVASEALLGYSSGCYTYMLWKFISNMLGKEVIKLEGRGIDFSNKEKEALDYFF